MSIYVCITSCWHTVTQKESFWFFDTILCLFLLLLSHYSVLSQCNVSNNHRGQAAPIWVFAAAVLTSVESEFITDDVESPSLVQFCQWVSSEALLWVGGDSVSSWTLWRFQHVSLLLPPAALAVVSDIADQANDSLKDGVSLMVLWVVKTTIIPRILSSASSFIYHCSEQGNTIS